MKFANATDPEIAPMLAALGISQQIPNVTDQSPSVAFDVTKSGLSGVAWIDYQSGLPVQQLYFTWDANRLVTMRLNGDQAIG